MKKLPSKKEYTAKKAKIVMHEFKTGALKSSSGQHVKDRKQALAIMLSEADRGYNKLINRKRKK